MAEKGERTRRLVESIFATHDDEIQCVAAQKLMAFCVAELLTDEQARQRYPALWTHFRFCSSCAADYQALMTVARQEQNAAALIPAASDRPRAPRADWIAGLGYLWRQLADPRQVVVLLSGEAPGPTAFAPALKGPAAEDADLVRRLDLTPDASGDLDLQITVRRSQVDAGYYTLAVRAQFRSRWQTLAGTTVAIAASGWETEGKTDDNGEVVFEGIAEESLAALTIKINA